MSHLSAETLARLGSEDPSSDERAHLDVCARCAAVREQLRRQQAVLAALPPLKPPPHAWPAIEAALAERGGGRRRTSRHWSLAAAAVLVFAVGIAAGVGVAAWNASRGDSLPEDRPVAVAGDSRQVVAQLAALENILLTTEAALRDAPEDPMLSRYRATALRERQSLLTHVRLATSGSWY